MGRLAAARHARPVGQVQACCTGETACLQLFVDAVTLPHDAFASGAARGLGGDVIALQPRGGLGQPRPPCTHCARRQHCDCRRDHKNQMTSSERCLAGLTVHHPRRCLISSSLQRGRVYALVSGRAGDVKCLHNTIYDLPDSFIQCEQGLLQSLITCAGNGAVHGTFFVRRHQCCLWLCSWMKLPRLAQQPYLSGTIVVL